MKLGDRSQLRLVGKIESKIQGKKMTLNYAFIFWDWYNPAKK